MRLLVIGKTGQVAHSLVEKAAEFPKLTMVASGRPELDLTRPGAAAALIEDFRPDTVINAAAYTAVDQAENEPNLAFRINADAAGEIALAASRMDARLLHLSTDYVFDGESAVAYPESAPTSPINVYGRSKLAGEEAVRDSAANYLILRTSWVYSPFGKNFVKTMMDLADEREELAVVADQRGCPTSAVDLADAILTLCSLGGRQSGTFHLAGSGATSWFDLAHQTMVERDRLGLRAAAVRPIKTADYPTAARRPLYSVLDCSAFATAFGFGLPPWQESLRGTVERLARSHAI